MGGMWKHIDSTCLLQNISIFMHHDLRVHYLKLVLKEVGYPSPREKQPGFETLLQIMVSQQLSTKAAAAIWKKLVACFTEGITAKNIQQATAESLRSCGFSRRKVEYAKDLSDRVVNDNFDLLFTNQKDTDEVIKDLCKIRGVGRWTAEVYAMFALGRLDIYPAKDLALQVAIQRYAGMKDRPTEKEVQRISLKWSPYQTAAALLMWKYYGSTTLD
ncbi:MAG: DNA-3-methyladenine glycosylase 2 family protein [Gammaproteobacteria bacterium]|nr:DNA-3-methyladenine glycosylase 2 family protein [Gammaproteobacteria bacterium]